MAKKKKTERAPKRSKAPAKEGRSPRGAPNPAADPQGRADLTIVGVGASAGGLQAFSQLLEAIPAKSGLTLVLIQHLAAKHPSSLATLLGAKSSLPVIEVTEDMSLVTGHVYVIPPGQQMELQAGKLHLTPRPEQGKNLPVNHFFRSLAGQCGSKAIGVVLSGTANDGAEGLREIKAAGGITIAQDPDTAAYDGMPRASIATGMVDLVLDLPGIAAELTSLAGHPYVRRWEPRDGEEFNVGEDHLKQIFQMLRSASGVDFAQYKLPTIKRRLQRRMALHKLWSIDQYVRYLQQNPGEVNLLYQDMLINVTRVFREPDSFEGLRKIVFSNILEQHTSENPIRVWVPGCATGEEAYSVAISLLEFVGDTSTAPTIQVFATDVSEAAIQHARNGIYPESIAGDVPSDRLLRYFHKVDGNYRISKTVRDLCVFARQDLTRDPPFSKLDLIVCRNVLIYLGQPLQKQLMTVFHYALKPGGFLMLGSAESTGQHGELFKVVDKRYRIYSKKSTLPRIDMEFHPAIQTTFSRRLGKMNVESTGMVRAETEASQILLSKYAPPGVIIDADLQIIQFRGQTGAYLEPAPGEASLNLLKMAREGLLHGLRGAVNDARKNGTAARKAGLRIASDGNERIVDLEVLPLGGQKDAQFYLVLFEETAAAPEKAAPRRRPEKPNRKTAAAELEAKLQRLQDELAANRDYLQSIIQELEAANEELQSANEEILSSNEELQSTNEELDMAKEELQSTNEELNTVNEELHGRNEELSQVNSDLLNLLGNVQIAIVIVAADLRIRRFTPMAEKILNLIPSDLGRPISHIKPNIDCPDLEQIITSVVEHVEPVSREVQDMQGNWYSLRVRPYKDMENRIDGAVMALFDVAMSERAAQELTAAYRLSKALFDALPMPAAVLDERLQVRMLNRGFCQRLRLAEGEIKGHDLWEAGKGWALPEWRQPLTELVNETDPHRNSIMLSRDDRQPDQKLYARRISGERVLLMVEIQNDLPSLN